MDDLIAFLRARLDELEDAARCAPGPDWWEDDKPIRWGDDTPPEIACGKGRVAVIDIEKPTAAAHIVLNDPARVLRDVASNRKPITRYVAAIEDLHRLNHVDFETLADPESYPAHRGRRPRPRTT
jgi:uncharacterized protein DUF6221